MLAIGQRIRQLREQRGLSQDRVARAIDSSQNYLSLLETNKRQPSLGTLEALSEALKCRVGDFFHTNDVESQSLVIATDMSEAYQAAEMRGERILAQDTFKQLNRVATLYEVQFTLKDYFDRGEPWAKIAEVISKDRVLVVKVWEAGRERALERGKVLEGPERGQPPATGHVETALRFLGETGIRAIVLQVTEKEQQDFMSEISLGCPEFDRSFWCQGVLTAHAMYHILQVSGKKEADVPSASVIFRMGLLLDVGILFMNLEDPTSVRNVWVECTRTPSYSAYAQSEWRLYQRYLHAVKGAQVMRLARWSSLETHVTEYHHSPAAIGTSHPYLPIVQCAHVADIIASLLVYAPALSVADLDPDPEAFDRIFKGRNIQFIRRLVGEIVASSRADVFNQLWNWPGYRVLLNHMVPSIGRRGQVEDRRRPEDQYQPFSWWLNRNEGRVVEMLNRYQKQH